MVLASVGSSTSSRVRSTLVVYRDPATGSDWVETDRGPLRVAREEVERIAAEGEVVQVARPAAEADLPSEVLERCRAPRVPRRDVQGLLEPTPVDSGRAPAGPAEAPAAAEQPPCTQLRATSLEGEERPGQVASEQSPCMRLPASLLEEEARPGQVASEQPAHLQFPATPWKEEPRPGQMACEQPTRNLLQANVLEEESRPDLMAPEQSPRTRSQSVCLDNESRPTPALSDPPSESRHANAGRTATLQDSHGSCTCRPGHRGRRAPIPAAVFRKLWLRSGGKCENPGCGRGGPLHAHHDDAWSDEHHHDPHRMRLLCERCHAQVHEDDFSTRLDWASARAWRMSRSGRSDPAQNEGPLSSRARQSERLPGSDS